MVALSSAEAELYAMVAASAESLAVIAYARDLGVDLGGEVYTDSAAALGITHRAGIGKVRHLRTQGLWVQEVRVAGRLHYKKVLGTKNPSDVLTKHVPGELLERHLESMGAQPRSGRAETAPELNCLESVVFVMDVDQDGCENVDRPEEQKETKSVRFATKVLYRAIPFVGRGRPTKAKKKAVWPTLRRPSTSTPATAQAQGEFLEKLHESDAPGAQAQGELRNAARRRPSSDDKISWADATEREFGP